MSNVWCRVVGRLCLVAVAFSVGSGCEKSGEAGTAQSPVVAGPLVAPAVVPAVQPAVFQIKLDPPLLDLGVVAPNQDATGSIAIRNLGADPVRILSVRPSCKCTTLNDLAGTVIEPGGAATLTARLDGRAVMGVRTASIRILIEGAPAPYQLDLRAEVSLPVRITPGILNTAAETRGHVVVESIDEQPFNILSVNEQPPVYVDFNPDRDAWQSSYLLKWDLTEEKAAGRLEHWWIVETDHPLCPLVDAWVRDRSTIQIPPRGRPWRVIGLRSNVGIIEPGSFGEFTLDVKNIGATDEIYSVQSLSADFSAELLDFERKGADAVCTIRITPRPEFTGLLRGRVELIASTHTHKQDVIGKVG